jgi:hypothetical protein
MTERTKYPQLPYVVTTTRHESSEGRVSWYHTLSDGRIVGYWERRNVDTGAPVPSEWVEVAPVITDALLGGGK